MHLNVLVSKRSEQRQRADRYTDIAYDVEVTLEEVAQATLQHEVMFQLPEFGHGASAEPYRVDSAHDFRADQSSDPSSGGRRVRMAKLRDGRWYGGFYVYAPEHQANDAECIQALKAALTRVILAALRAGRFGT
jgi:hypothetical protein